jgi:hypothetical protein
MLVLLLKNSPQHWTKWLNKDINANNNYSTYNTKIHKKEKNYIFGSKNQSAQNHQRKRTHNAHVNTGLNAHFAQDA